MAAFNPTLISSVNDISRLKREDEHLRRHIEAVMRKHPSYGHKRIADDLKISRKRARRIMKLYGLKPARRASALSKPDDPGNPESNVLI